MAEKHLVKNGADANQLKGKLPVNRVVAKAMPKAWLNETDPAQGRVCRI